MLAPGRLDNPFYSTWCDYVDGAQQEGLKSLWRNRVARMY